MTPRPHDWNLSVPVNSGVSGGGILYDINAQITIDVRYSPKDKVLKM